MNGSNGTGATRRKETPGGRSMKGVVSLAGMNRSETITSHDSSWKRVRPSSPFRALRTKCPCVFNADSTALKISALSSTRRIFTPNTGSKSGLGKGPQKTFASPSKTPQKPFQQVADFALQVAEISILGDHIRFHIRIQGMSVAQLTRRILIVDDTPGILLLMTVTLQRAGYQTENASNGREGLKKFRDGSWDLMVTDLQMPETSGEEMAEVIKIEAPTTPMIMVTGSQNFVRNPGLFDAFFAKPFSSADLVTAVEKALR